MRDEGLIEFLLYPLSLILIPRLLCDIDRRIGIFAEPNVANETILSELCECQSPSRKMATSVLPSVVICRNGLSREFSERTSHDYAVLTPLHPRVVIGRRRHIGSAGAVVSPASCPRSSLTEKKKRPVSRSSPAIPKLVVGEDGDSVCRPRHNRPSNFVPEIAETRASITYRKLRGSTIRGRWTKTARSAFASPSYRRLPNVRRLARDNAAPLRPASLDIPNAGRRRKTRSFFAGAVVSAERAISRCRIRHLRVAG